MAAMEVILDVPPLHLMLQAAVKGDHLRIYEFGKEGSVPLQCEENSKIVGTFHKTEWLGNIVLSIFSKLYYVHRKSRG